MRLFPRKKGAGNSPALFSEQLPTPSDGRASSLPSIPRKRKGAPISHLPARAPARAGLFFSRSRKFFPIRRARSTYVRKKTPFFAPRLAREERRLRRGCRTGKLENGGADGQQSRGGFFPSFRRAKTFKLTSTRAYDWRRRKMCKTLCGFCAICRRATRQRRGYYLWRRTFGRCTQAARTCGVAQAGGVAQAREKNGRATRNDAKATILLRKR